MTDLCNYRCVYCMPESGVMKCAHEDILSIEELAAIGREAVKLGVTKIRLTGGEPLVRRGIVDLCRELSALPGLEELVITTNGSLLPEMAAPLREAGVSRVNISLDTLDPDRFRLITRGGELADVLRGIEAAERAGFKDIKLDTVLMGGINDDEAPAMAKWACERGYTIRFIELMPIGECAAWEKERFVPCGTLLDRMPGLTEAGASGVSRLYRYPNLPGAVGLISPMSHSFCAGCDRIRLTADGKLKPCLHSAEEYPVRGLSGRELADAIAAAAADKPECHTMIEAGASGSARAMNSIGG